MTGEEIKARLEEIKKRLSLVVNDEGACMWSININEMGHSSIDDLVETVCWVNEELWNNYSVSRFIANAPADIDFLLAEVARLSELAGRLWGNNVWLDLAAKQNLHLLLADKQKAADSYE